MSDEAVEMDPMTAAEREEQIRLAAYSIWKANGEPEGTDARDWKEAEAAVAETSEEEENTENAE
ncbi:MAG: DUF2934 domain-containing protein [Chlorobiaceae bacterium]|nr:DUF2934 domain-containing protein [Chlorobiaceae bacterium]NTV60885.1 DUF2934 domain-containing protein [Chlorobiaceae bacterium]